MISKHSWLMRQSVSQHWLVSLKFPRPWITLCSRCVCRLPPGSRGGTRPRPGLTTSLTASTTAWPRGRCSWPPPSSPWVSTSGWLRTWGDVFNREVIVFQSISCVDQSREKAPQVISQYCWVTGTYTLGVRWTGGDHHCIQTSLDLLGKTQALGIAKQTIQQEETEIILVQLSY